MHVEKGAKAVHYESGPDMTPLVDVVMVLLIFLMMAGKFGGAIRYLVSDMPITTSGPSQAQIDPSQIPKQEVMLRVTSPTPEQFRAFYAQSVNADSQEKLAGQLTGVLKGFTDNGTKNEDVQLFIKPERNVKYSHVVRVYTAAMQAGFTKIGFSTSE